VSLSGPGDRYHPKARLMLGPRPARLIWGPHGRPIPEDGDGSRIADEIRAGDLVRVCGEWRAAGRVSVRHNEGRTYVTVEWLSPAGSRTVFHGAGHVRIHQDPAPAIPPDRRLRAGC
jgi:hypothetical protein